MVEFTCGYFWLLTLEKYTVMTICNTVGPHVGTIAGRKKLFAKVHLFFFPECFFLKTFRNYFAFHLTNSWKMFAERLSLVLPPSRFSDTDVTSATLQTAAEGLLFLVRQFIFLTLWGKKTKKKKTGCIHKMLCSFIMRTIQCDIMHRAPSFRSSWIHFPVKYVNSLGSSFNKWLPVC